MFFSDKYCPLCQESQTRYLDQSKDREFFRCDDCALVFVPENFHLSLTDEKAIYDYHENDPRDPGYRAFLNRLCEPMIKHLAPGSAGLDFGCGPGPALHLLFEEAGCSMANYDPFYADDASVLEQQYDFVTATEVVEHLRAPADVFAQLFKLLNREGVLGIMTKTIPSLENFAHWHYTRDLTHIVFYARETLAFIARKYGYQLITPRSDVALFLPDKDTY